jgi:hypothetical protein
VKLFTILRDDAAFDNVEQATDLYIRAQCGVKVKSDSDDYSRVAGTPIP